MQKKEKYKTRRRRKKRKDKGEVNEEEKQDSSETGERCIRNDRHNKMREKIKEMWRKIYGMGTETKKIESK